MMKLALVASLAASAAVSLANIELVIHQPYKTVFRPSSGTLTLTFSGTIDVSPTFDAGPTTLTFPATSTHTLSGDFHSDLFDYLAQGPGVDYEGNLFTIEVESTTPFGEYIWVTGQPGVLSDFLVGAVDGQVQINARAYYGVTVVPEPVTMFGFGAGLMFFRKSKRRPW